MRSAADSELQN